MVTDQRYTITLLDLTVEGNGFVVFAFQNADDYTNNRPISLFRNVYLSQLKSGKTLGPFNTTYDAMQAVNNPYFKISELTPTLPSPPDFVNVIHVDFIKRKRLNIHLLK